MADRRAKSERRSISLPQRITAVDHQGRPGHVARGVTGQDTARGPRASGWPKSPGGMLARNRSLTSGWGLDQRRFGTVMKPPGRMAFTMILCTAQSAATARVNWSAAAFAV